MLCRELDRWGRLQDRNLNRLYVRMLLWGRSCASLCVWSNVMRDCVILSTMIFSFFKLEDSGTYTCVANNAAGEDSHTVSLTVHVLPTFTELPGDVSLNKGEQLRLSCRATGIPLPKLTWTFNNNIIPGW